MPEVLVPAVALVNGTTVRTVDACEDVTYVHLMSADHHVVESDGALTESFFPTSHSLCGFDADTRAELLAIFPELASVDRMEPARRVLRGFEARLVA